MKKMRITLAALLVLATMLCLCACGGEQPDPTTTATPVPTTTVPATTVPPTTVDDGLVEYKITVLYPDGTPVAGVKVQICLDDLCQMPVTTDENGVGIYNLPETEGYKAKVTKKLDGYLETEYVYFEAGATEVVIYLVAENAG